MENLFPFGEEASALIRFVIRPADHVRKIMDERIQQAGLDKAGFVVGMQIRGGWDTMEKVSITSMTPEF